MNTSCRDFGSVPGEGACAWTLRVLAGQGQSSAGALRGLRAGRPVVVGSGPAVGVRVEGLGLASRHVTFECVSGGLQVTDLGGELGTRIGGTTIGRVNLHHSADVHLGTVVIRVRRTLPGEQTPIAGLIGTSPAMLRLARQIRLYAPLNRTVLIQGETGAGKDVVARAIHRLSQRQGKYVALNVGALNDSLADSELFGHAKGAFTGAIQAREGAFREATKGTLFLDEIGDLSAAVQIKLLRAIEEKEVRPIGAQGVQVVDCRIVSACWADLSRLAERGTFRRDLYHRISTMTLTVPPLRERLCDLAALTEHFFDRYSPELGPRQISAGGLQRLQSYSWPGNIRELGSVLYRGAVLCEGSLVGEREIVQALPAQASPRKCVGRIDVRELLRLHDGNVSAAARAAGVARSTFRSRMAKLQLQSAGVGGQQEQLVLGRWSA